jgi:hypothetical protein
MVRSIARRAIVAKKLISNYDSGYTIIKIDISFYA